VKGVSVRLSRWLGLLPVGLAIAFVAGAVQAATIPVGSIQFGVTTTAEDGTPGVVWEHVYAGTQSPTDPNVYTWGDSYWADTGVYLEWSEVEADLDPFVSGNWAITNTSSVTQIFTLTVDLPVIALPSTLMYGTSSISVLDANGAGGATLASVGALALYNGRIDLAPVIPATNLFGPGYALVVGLLGSDSDTDSFGVPPGSIPGPAVVTTIGLQHVFSLTAGDRATFNSLFSVVVPEPGTLMLVLGGLGGLVLLGRRPS
jgi:hypothetical protein